MLCKKALQTTGAIVVKKHKKSKKNDLQIEREIYQYDLSFAVPWSLPALSQLQWVRKGIKSKGWIRVGGGFVWVDLLLGWLQKCVWEYEINY
jgi:hypothetical protein